VWEKPQELKDWEVDQIRLHDPRTSMILAGLQGSGRVEIIEKPKEDEEPKFFTPAFLNLGENATKQQQQEAQKAEAAKAAAAAVLSKKNLSDSGLETGITKAAPKDKSRPISSTPVPGTPWCVVWTGDLRSFFYNPTNKQSVWEKPAEMVGRSDVAKMLESPQAAEEFKKRQQQKALPVFEEPVAKKARVVSEQTPVVMTIGNEEVMIIKDDTSKKLPQGKEAAIEAEVRAARERAMVPLETRMLQFRGLLEEKQVSAFSSWEKELSKIVFDPRYLLLTSKERKTVFDKYVRERADEERKEKKAKAKERKENFVELCKEVGVTPKSSWSEFSREQAKDERFKAIEKSRDREAHFNDYVSELKKKEKEEKDEKRKAAKKGFKELLKETEGIDHHSHWSDFKKLISEDPRYLAVDKSNDREDWFLDFVQELKDEHRKEKDKKRAERSRSRSSSRGKKKKRSRSRSRSRDKKKKKDKDRSRSRSRSHEKSKKKKKDKDRSRSRDKDVKKEKKKKKDKEEGEMSDEDGDKRSESGEKENEEKKAVKEEEGKQNGSSGVNGSTVDQDSDSGEKPTEAEAEKAERVAAALAARQEAVKADMAGHLRDRDKERESHLHTEAVNAFSALLADLIRAPDFSWKEAKKILKKDSRYEALTGGEAALDKSERERLFDTHIDELIAKKKTAFRSLLEEQKEVALDAAFKDIKKLIKEDPRYTKFSTSDKKCEKEFVAWLRDRVSKARGDYRQLLQETKLITHKSLQMIKDKEGNHMEDIEEVLCKDSRYHIMEPLNDDRADILMSYLEELERRGPPPPPTATDGGRRK